MTLYRASKSAEHVSMKTTKYHCDGAWNHKLLGGLEEEEKEKKEEEEEEGTREKRKKMKKMKKSS